MEGIHEFAFSPRETYISTWTRFNKPLDGCAPENNVAVYEVKTGLHIYSFVQKSQTDWYVLIDPGTFNGQKTK